MTYKDLIPGQIYKGRVTNSSTSWIFKYTPWKNEEVKQFNEGHYGPAYQTGSFGYTRTKEDKLHSFSYPGTWIFSAASIQEKVKLYQDLGQDVNDYLLYEIY